MNYNQKEEILRARFGQWYPLLKDYLHSDRFWSILKTIGELRLSKGVEIYPEVENYFLPFRLCSPANLKVVFIGIGPRKLSNGLAYGQKEHSLSTTPEIEHIKKSLENAYDTVLPGFDVTLESWAKDGVLLLNQAITAPNNDRMAHIGLWSAFYLEILAVISAYLPATIFVTPDDACIDKEHNFIIDSKNLLEKSDGKIFKSINNALIEIGKARDLTIPEINQVAWYEKYDKLKTIN